MLDDHDNYSLKARLIHINYPSVVDMLPEEHTEIRRCHRILLGGLLKVYKREACIRRHEQPVILPVILYYYVELVLLRLIYLIYPSVDEFLLHVSYHIGYHYSVKRHICLSYIPEKRQKMQIHSLPLPYLLPHYCYPDPTVNCRDPYIYSLSYTMSNPVSCHAPGFHTMPLCCYSTLPLHSLWH